MMRRFLFAGLLVGFAHLAVAAAPRGAIIPPPPPPQAQPQPACVDPRDSAEYVPGVDAHSRVVAPADLPGSTTDVQVSTEVYAEMRTNNPQMPRVGVMANLPSLQARPPCPQSSPRAPAITVH
ncbi:MAG TPA: hypothetical protein VNH44_09965 [Micropepsaceae bacterium]|nr:hypothetical protein [Micropepsaceae bacterium]